MLNHKKEIMLVIFIALSFFAAGCENSEEVAKMQKDVAALNQEIEKKNAEIATLNEQLAYQVELTQKQGEDLKYILQETDEDLKALKDEIVSIKKGEIASFKIDMTGIRKEIDALHTALQKLDDESRINRDSTPAEADVRPEASGTAEEAAAVF